MIKEWYISMDNKPFGPLDFETIGNMLNNRTLLFVDYIWKKDFEQWKRICEVGTFNLLLPKIPEFEVKVLEKESKQIESVEDFILEKKKEKKVEIKTQSQIRGKRDITELTAELVIHDDRQVFHARMYGITKDEFFIACRSQNLPLNTKLFMVVSSKDFDGVYHCKGTIGGVSKTTPLGYCVNVSEMPKELLEVVQSSSKA